MRFKRILITGGAGFVGSNLAELFRRRFDGVQCTAFDNLKRRGSESALARLKRHGAAFVHGDIRCPDDLEALPDFDLLIDCAAEPSVHAGVGGSPMFVLNTNLTGTMHCLELARRRSAAVLFLSTSRVYPIAALNAIPFDEEETRYGWRDDSATVGASSAGVTEEFPLTGARSWYGATKLAAELLVQEFVWNCGLPGLVNRCGLLAGPWQMGKVDQGVFALWTAAHYYGRPLRYIGYGGTGKQVRDVLHVADLFELLVRQIERLELWDGRAYNVGGGSQSSVSLRELTELCRRVTGRETSITPVPETATVDLRIYLSDCRRAECDFDWRPTRTPEDIALDIHAWIASHADELAPILNP